MPAKPKTLAELLESPDVGLPEQTYQFCLSAKLNVEFERIDSAIEDALAADAASRKRVGEKSEAMKLDAEREKLRAKMSEHQVTIRLRAKPAHEWRKWVAKHPAREDDNLDGRLGLNADALQGSVPDYIVDVNGEPLANGQWAKLAEIAAPGDLFRLAGIVRELHGSGAQIPKSLTAWVKKQVSDGD